MIEEGMVANIIHLCDLSNVFQFVNLCSSVFLHWCYSYRLIMDESKSETNVKCCARCAVIHYIFHVMYGKIVSCNQRKSWIVGCNLLYFP
jgi:hypothetical protein